MKLLDLMATGQMRCTHSFYMKMFHILVMNGTILLPAVDKLFVDEAQDLSSISLDIFDKIPATQKVMVGDSNQSIFEFLKLENGFDRFSNTGITLRLTKTFRLTSKLATAVQRFANTTFDPELTMEGMDYPPNPAINTKVYLTRTNSSLISKMISLNKTNTPYRLANAAKVKQMFKLPLALIYLKPGFKQNDPELKPLQRDADKWGALPDHVKKSLSMYKHIREEHKENNALIQAMTLISANNTDDIIEAAKQAEAHKKSSAALELMTAHTSKGITRDQVELDDDMNDSIIDLVGQSHLTPPERAELNLYFVAITRGRYIVLNASHLKPYLKEQL